MQARRIQSRGPILLLEDPSTALLAVLVSGRPDRRALH